MFVFRKKTIPDLATFNTYFQYYLQFFPVKRYREVGFL